MTYQPTEDLCHVVVQLTILGLKSVQCGYNVPNLAGSLETALIGCIKLAISHNR